MIIPELAKYGGAERYLIECVSRWQKLHDITIYSSIVNADLLAEHGIGKKVKISRLSPYFEGRHSILLNTALLPKIWEQEIGKHDIYHTHLWPTHLIDLHPMVWYPHEPLRILHDLRYEQPLEDVAATRQRDLHIYPKYNYDRIADVTYEAYLSSMDLVDKLGKPDRVVANSRYTAGYLEGVYGTPVRDVVYPGVNVDDFIFQPSDENIFLTIGQLWPHKRIKLIIEALKLVENAQLYIVGSGPEKEKLARIAEGMGLDNRVFFLHGLSNLEVKILFSRALGVVFMPVKEPFGIVALEAMAAGKPLIAANEGGFTEVVDESCALLVAPEPEEIAERMRFLRDNKDVARRWAPPAASACRPTPGTARPSNCWRSSRRTHDKWTREHVRPRVDSHAAHHAVRRAVLLLVRQRHRLAPLERHAARRRRDRHAAAGLLRLEQLQHDRGPLAAVRADGTRLRRFSICTSTATASNAYEQAAAESIFSVVDRLQHERAAGDSDLPLRLHARAIDRTRWKRFAGSSCRGRRIFTTRASRCCSISGPACRTATSRGSILSTTARRAFLRIASSLRMYSAKDERRHSFGLFHGWSLYSPLELSAPANWERVWMQAYRNSDAGTRNLKILSVSPGYDDRHLRDPNRKTNPHRNVDRQQGDGVSADARLCRCRSHDVPDMVLISTFNEYHENTHIEPSRNHGSLYLEMTQKFVAGRKAVDGANDGHQAGGRHAAALRAGRSAAARSDRPATRAS